MKESSCGQLFSAELDGNGNRLSLTKQSRFTNLMGFWENANFHPETSNIQTSNFSTNQSMQNYMMPENFDNNQTSLFPTILCNSLSDVNTLRI